MAGVHEDLHALSDQFPAGRQSLIIQRIAEDFHWTPRNAQVSPKSFHALPPWSHWWSSGLMLCKPSHKIR